ncbi:MAG: hypothetical protein QM784_28180 [Polyangiaceae bacterium]
MGTAHPLVLQNASYRYGWMVACQARSDTNRNGQIDVSVGYHGETFGDELQPYLMVGPGPGEAIESYLGESPSGRFVAFRQDGRLWVFDAARRARLDLSEFEVDLTDDSNATLGHAAVSFSPGHHLALIRRSGKQQEVIAVDLETRQAHVLYATRDPIWRAEYDSQGSALSIWELSADTDGNGALESPRIQTTLAARGCRAAAMSYSTFGRVGDRPVEKRIPISDPDLPEPPESLKGSGGCLLNGSHVMAQSDTGAWLISTLAQGTVIPVNFGPVRWQTATRAPAAAYCSHTRSIPPCRTWHEQAVGAFCMVARYGCGVSIWGHPPEWYWVEATAYVQDSGGESTSHVQRVHSGYYYSYGDSAHNVWLLGESKVAHWDGQRLVEKSGPHFEGVIGILAVSKQVAWALGEGERLYRWTTEDTSLTSLPGSSRLMAFWATGDTQVYAANYEGTTFRWDGQQWLTAAQITGDIITGLWGDGNQLWGISSMGKLQTLRGQQWQLVAELVRPERRYFETLRDIRGTGPADIWISTSANRLLHWDGHAVQTYDGHGWEVFDDIVSVSSRAVWVNAGGALIRLKRGA